MEGNIISERISKLRLFMKNNNLQAFIIPSSDVHQSEYPPAHWASREWISGFSGSAGSVVVTMHESGLWTDSRYFLQAEEELKGTGIQLFKEGVEGTPSIAQWLLHTLPAGSVVGIDGNVYSAGEVQGLLDVFDRSGLTLNTDSDPFATIWEDRPAIPHDAVFVMPVEVAGKSTAEKVADIRRILQEKNADSLLIASLDTVAWLFNLRGNDVPYNPVFVSFAYVSQSETILFVYPDKLSDEIADDLQKQGVTLAHYDKIIDYISSLSLQRILLQPEKTSYSLYHAVSQHNKIIAETSVADLLKAAKNEVELAGFRAAMVRDGVALVRFFRWLEEAVPQGNVDECMIADKLVEYRSQQQRYVGESFGTIAGYQANGAIVHYHAKRENCKKIHADGFLLIDSGAQYFDGTTDITRTLALGALTEQMKEDYTLVLKGHIALSEAIFPEGTRGAQLDVLARQFLWARGANYLHGTGHGIGHFLNVHEGPQNIRLEENPTALQLGMVVSNEPGVYRAGRYGIRIENLQVVTPSEIDSEFGQFCRFETLTLCPIDTVPIITDLLTPSEIQWLNTYHHKVYEKLSPHLSEVEKEWLRNKTKEI